VDESGASVCALVGLKRLGVKVMVLRSASRTSTVFEVATTAQ
jgi:hypothetical protein